METEKKGNGTGCLLVVAIAFVIIGLTQISYEEFASFGETILALVGLGIVVLIVRAFSKNNSNGEEAVINASQSKEEQSKSPSALKTVLIIIGVLALAVVVITSITSSRSFNHSVGILAVAALGLGAAIWFVSSLNDDN